MEKFLKKNWNVLLSIIIGLTILIFGIFKDHPKTEATRDAAIALIISLLITFLHRLNSYQQLIEDNQDVISKFIQLLSKNPKIRETVNFSFEAHNNNNQFYKFFLSEILEEFNGHLQSISQGKYICNSEAELTLTKTILQCCNKCLKAISYQDEKWWTSNDGVLYLSAHEEHIDNAKEKATRIFIIEKKSEESLKPIFKRHKELNIETYILYSDTDGIDDKYKIDFVIYDDYMLRTASEVKNIEGGKDAIFTTEDANVKKFLTLFEQLLVIAKSKKNPIPV